MIGVKGRPRTEPNNRELAMAADYRAGKTLAEIGVANGGISRERVRQLLTKYFGIRAKDGGQAWRARKNRVSRSARRDEQCLKRWGCTSAQYLELRYLRKPVRDFVQQRANAYARGIRWELNLWQWWTIWQESGHWAQRGRGNGYMMCRKGDDGPYSPDNVFIQRGIYNSSEAQKRSCGLPIGVRVSKTPGRFTAKRCINGKQVGLGTFSTPEAAHAAYLAADPFLGVAA